jgi:hypothetical protein
MQVERGRLTSSNLAKGGRLSQMCEGMALIFRSLDERSTRFATGVNPRAFRPDPAKELARLEALRATIRHTPGVRSPINGPTKQPPASASVSALRTPETQIPIRTASPRPDTMSGASGVPVLRQLRLPRDSCRFNVVALAEGAAGTSDGLHVPGNVTETRQRDGATDGIDSQYRPECGQTGTA